MRSHGESHPIRRISCAALVAALSVLAAVPGLAQPNSWRAEPPSFAPSAPGPLTLEGAGSLGSGAEFAYGRLAQRISFHTKAGVGRLELSGLVGEGAQNGGDYGRVEGRLALDVRRSTAWLGVAGQRDYDRGENSPPLLGVGAWVRLGDFVPSAAAQQTPDVAIHTDYHYSYAESAWVGIDRRQAIRRATIHTGLSWSHGRVALESIAGVSLSPVAGPRTWVRGGAAMTLWPGLALVATGGSAAPALFGTPESQHGQTTLGIRLTPAWSHTPTAGHTGDSPAWRVFVDGAGWYRIEVRVAKAQSVEITSDATDWAPRSLEQVAKDRWRLRLQLAPGVYHMNLRIDGGPWVVPPGAPTATDEFIGATGVLVVQK